jgi:hypothetical protein
MQLCTFCNPNDGIMPVYREKSDTHISLVIGTDYTSNITVKEAPI